MTFKIRYEDGYVRVIHTDGHTICAAVATSNKILRDITFLRPADQKCNATRQAAMRLLQAEGYK